MTMTPASHPPGDATMLAGMEDLIAAMKDRRHAPAAEDGDSSCPPSESDEGDALADAPWEAIDAGSAEPERMPERGAVVGRYIVLQELGAGAMGVVYAAHDPELDRKVALKMLRRGFGGAGARARLRREAQTLGKLSHPNVVAVHDVGTVGGQVWLAMELVHGRTLREWLATPHSWRDVVRVMLGAGEGLAAAHAASLLHRDFKPDNVMVGDDGRVRVMDFGLARMRTDAMLVPDQAHSSARTDALAPCVTRPGALLGTPGYMAPEQFDGKELTGAADQFAFCVSLWEALYGERPFAGRTWMELAANVLGGVLRAPTKGRRVPAYLRRTMQRGLAIEPGARWPSMQALLAELRRIARPPWQRWTARASVAGALAAGAAGLWHYTLVGRLCTGAEHHMDGIWDDARRSRVRSAIASNDVPYAADALRQTERSLDAYRDGWISMRTEACEATNVHGEQPAEILVLREVCLDAHRVALAATVDVLSVAGDGRVAEHAVAAVGDLPPLERCADLVRLRSEAPLPEDPEAVVEVWALRERLARAAANTELARYDEALVDVEGVVQRAEDLGHPPVIAEARLRQGELHAARGALSDAEADLRKAHLVALETGYDRAAAEAAVALSSLVGVVQMRHAEGTQWGETGLALAERLQDHTLVVEQMGVLGDVLVRSGQPVEGLAQYRAAWSRHVKANALEERIMDSTAIPVASGMGRVLVELDEPEQAMAVLQWGLQAAVRRSGEEHPLVVEFLDGMGLALLEQSKLAEAVAHIELARTVGDDVLAPEDPRSIDPEVALCRSAGVEGRARTGVARCRRALARASASFGDAHPRTAAVRSVLGWILLEWGEAAEAAAEQRRALEHAEAALGPGHPVVGRILLELAEAELVLSQPELALEHAQRGVEIGEHVYGPWHSMVGWGLRAVAEARVRLGDTEGARAGYERAIEVLVEARGPEHPATIRATLGLARVLVRLGRANEAIEHARHAVAMLETIEAPAALVTEARALLEGSDAHGDEVKDG